MQVGDSSYRSIWVDEEDNRSIRIIDQTKLPFRFEVMSLGTVEEVYDAIVGMKLRGAPLIGAAASFGMYLATLETGRYSGSGEHLLKAAKYLKSSRPTAVNLEWAVDRQLASLLEVKDVALLPGLALKNAMELCDLEADNCRMIGTHGLELIGEISRKKKGEQVNILTHCNAGWLACIDWGTATAPIYLAHERGIKLHVWVDETRPRNQGARLTAWELREQGVSHTLVTDNAGGHLMQKGMVDLVIVGCDRAARNGDIANKTGTYLKALAAYDNDIPFYSAMPTSTIDLGISDGISGVEIEERSEEEVTMVEGLHGNEIISVRICPEGTPASNMGFDITPARLITGLITEKGICSANEKEILNLFPEKD